MSILSLSESNLIKSMLKNPDQDFQKIEGIIEDKIQQCESDLQQSEELIKSVYYQSPYAIDIFDIHGYLIQANSAFENLWGVPREFAIEKFNLLKSKQIIEDGWLPYVEKAYAGEIVRVPDKYFDASLEPEAMGRGRERWIKAIISPIKNIKEDVTNIVIIHEDFTDQKLMELKIIESEEKFRSLFEDSPVGLIDQDFSELKKYVDQLKASGITDFSKFFDDQPNELLNIMTLPKIIDVNRRAIELYGARNKEDFILKMNQLSENIENSMTEELFLYNKMEILSLINGGIMYDSEIETKSFKEEYLCLYAKTSIVTGFESTWSNVIVTIEDITERKQTEEKLQKEYELNKKLIQSSPAYYAAINNKGKIIVINDMMLDVLGYTLKEVLNEDYLTKLIPEREHKFLWKTFRSLTDTSKLAHINNHIITKSGQELLVEWHGRAVFKRNGEFDYIFGFGIDITKRAKAEKKLKKSEEKYRNFLENLQGIAFQGKLDFTPIFFHGKVEEITGYKEEDFISQNPRWDQIIVDEYIEKLREGFDKIHDIPNTVIEREYQIINKDRKKKWINEIISNISDEDGKPYLVQGIITEITDRKEIEQALEDSEEKYRTLYETSKDGLALVDTMGNFTDCNPAYSDLLKCSREKLLKLNYHQFTPNKWRSLDDLMTKQAIDNGFTDEFEKEFINSHGEIIPVNVRLWVNRDYSGKLIGIWGLVRNISERQKAAEALIASEEKYRTLVETSSMGLIEISFVTKELAYFNPKLMEIIGYTNEELMKENAFQKFIHPEDLKEMDFSRTDRKLEFRVISKDGKIKWLSGDRLYYYDKKGTLAYARLWLQDITEKKSLEEIKANLLMRFSHEFKTPLISIKGFSEFLLEEYRDKLSEKIISFLEKIHQGAEKLKFLTNTFLETSQLDENIVRVKIREVKFANLINRVLAELEGIIKSRNHTINLKIDKNLLIECDSEKISIVMSNLILNSSKFTPPAGLITVSANKERDSVIITVNDNGIGLSIEEIKKIFLPFGKIERYGQGFDIVPDGIGMGLYISKELVELHKGTIWVESAGRNKGSTFTIKIPRNQ